LDTAKKGSLVIIESGGSRTVFMGGVLPWQKSCDIVSGCIYFIGEMIWCVQPQLSTSYGFFSHVKNTQLYLLVLKGCFALRLISCFAIFNLFLLQINLKRVRDSSSNKC
jgi:hypothetical protein